MSLKHSTIYFFSFLLLLTSCGPKAAKMGAVAPVDAAVSAVVEKHYANEANFRTLQGRLAVNYESPGRSQNVTVSFRMKKNDTIWMSGQLLGIPLAKVLITPDSVKFYEKITQTYFDGDFSLLSDLLGIPLDFQKVQNLLIGQTIYDLREEPYRLTESTKGYQLESVEQTFLDKLFLLDPGNYKAVAQQLGQQQKNRSLTITYPEYQRIGEHILPREIEVIANEEGEQTGINLVFRSIEMDVPVSFPFSIPSGYEEIDME